MTASVTKDRRRHILLAAMPSLFVLLWSTGFIGARFGLPYAEPFTFLLARFLLTLAVLIPLVFLLGGKWPRGVGSWGRLAVSGLLVHGAYLGGVFYAIERGMPAGLASLLVGLQPLLTTAMAGPMLGERAGPGQWLGLVLGLVGVGMVLTGTLDPGEHLFAGFGFGALAWILLALLGITLGTLYQKRYCAGQPLLGGAVAQYLGAGVVLSLGALLFETGKIEWSFSFIMALIWLAMGLSIGAILLLMTLIERGEASRVASLFYLVPPATALEAWWLFDERLPLLSIIGMAVTIVGVVLAVRAGRPGS